MSVPFVTRNGTDHQFLSSKIDFVFHYNKTNILDTLDLEIVFTEAHNIKNKKYVWYVDFWLPSLNQDRHQTGMINFFEQLNSPAYDKILQDVNDGNCLLVVDGSAETLQGHFNKNIPSLLNRINFKNLIVITGMVLGPNLSNTYKSIGCEIIELNSLANRHFRHNKDLLHKLKIKKINAITSNLIQKKAVLYIGKAKFDRMVVLSHLAKSNKLNDIFYSCLEKVYDESTYSTQRSFFTSFHNESYSKIIDDILWNYIPTDSDIHGCMRDDDLSITQACESFFNIVIETNDILKEKDENYKFNFITEKTFKAFTMLQPFIIFAEPYHIRYLESLGFDVFRDIINHSYDVIENHNDRMIIFLKELDRLLWIDNTVWADIIKDILPRLLSNFNHFQKNPFFDINKKKILEEKIINFVAR